MASVEEAIVGHYVAACPVKIRFPDSPGTTSAKKMSDGMLCQTRLRFFVCIDVIHSCLFYYEFFRISHLLSLLDSSLPGRLFAVHVIVYHTQICFTCQWRF